MRGDGTTVPSKRKTASRVAREVPIALFFHPRTERTK